MVNYITVIVLVALVGFSAALPQRTARARIHRQSDDDVVVPVDDNALPEAPVVPETPAPDAEAQLGVTLSSRSALDDDTVEVGDGEDNTLGLPSNATSIRAKISATFSCDGRNYGYYADVDNDCQVFHVCLPTALPGRSGRSQTFKWSFICPEQTIFNQESFTCTRPEDSAACDDAPSYYRLNDNFGVVDPDQSRSNNGDVSLHARIGGSDIQAEQAPGAPATSEEVAPVAPETPEEATTPSSAEELS